MKHSFFRNTLSKTFLFVAFCMMAFINNAHAGLDYYEIYVGKKLVLKRAVNQPLQLESLPINQSNINDQLIINYYQCNAPDKLASNRIITLKDANGNKVKEWKFANAKGSNICMMISVKELLQLQKSGNTSLALFYTAQGKIQEEKLVSITSNNKTTDYLESHSKEYFTAMFLCMKRYMVYKV